MVKEPVAVQILGRTFYIDAFGIEPIYAQSLAKFVEDKITEIRNSSSQPQEASREAILAALNIADELFRLKEEHENMINSFNDKTENLISAIDAVIK